MRIKTWEVLDPRGIPNKKFFRISAETLQEAVASQGKCLWRYWRSCRNNCDNSNRYQKSESTNTSSRGMDSRFRRRCKITLDKNVKNRVDRELNLSLPFIFISTCTQAFLRQRIYVLASHRAVCRLSSVLPTAMSKLSILARQHSTITHCNPRCDGQR